MDPQLLILHLEAFQRQEYPDEAVWFWNDANLDQLLEVLEELIEAGEQIE